MKSFIRAITIIVVLSLLLMVAITPISAQEIVTEGVNVVANAPVSYSSDDALMQLRTVLSKTNQQHGGEKVLVIPTAQIQPQQMATLMEDMTVMCRIFDKKLAQSSLNPETPVWLRLSSSYYSMGDRSMAAMYIQGYGALFMINVDFPLSPPPKTEEEKEETKEDADPVWEQMKQEIFSPEEAIRYAPDRSEEKYDARKVKNLKSTLINALVHTANIRGLKPNEYVILTVTGSGVSSNIDKVVAITGTNQVVVHYKDNNVTKLLDSPSLSDLGISSPTVLTIRAKKSYIDALAQNKIDYEEFEQKVQLISYPSLGQNISGRSSTSFWPTGTYGDWSPPSLPSVGVFEGRRSDRRRGRSSGIDTMEPSSSDRRAGR